MRIRLYTRYALIIIAVVVFVAATLSLISLRQFHHSMTELSDLSEELIKDLSIEKTTAQGVTLAVQLAKNLRNPLYYLEMDEMEQLLEVSQAQSDVLTAIIVDREFNILQDGSDDLGLFGQRVDLSEIQIRRLKSSETLNTIVNDSLEVISPIILGNEFLGCVVLRYSLDELYDNINQLKKTLDDKQAEYFKKLINSVLLVTIALITAGAAVSTFVARKLKDPIEQLARFAQQVGSGILDKKVDIKRNDELGELASSLNHMASRLDRRTREIQFLAYHDALTKLPNRDYLKNNLSAAITRAKRHESSLALLFIDIDNFKMVNDVYGHEAGDFILVTVARRLQECLRDCDTIAMGADPDAREAVLGRLAGDEFIVLLEGGEKAIDAGGVSKRILESISSSYQWQKTSINLGISIGIAVYPDNGEDTETLLRNADAAMYHVKGLGKNNFHFFSPELDLIAHKQLELVDQLDQAMKNDELELWYQSQVDTFTGKIVGAEALLRWRHPEKGLLMPEVFVPLAEKSVHVLTLGDWVLRNACQQLKQWHEIVPDFHMAINVSPLQLQREGWLKSKLSSYVDDRNLASKISLEVTETFFLHAEGTAKTEIQQIKSLGFQIWLDDFGTGYSSLNHLKHFPVDGVKIDRSFISGMDDQWESKALSKAIIRVAQAFDIGVIAEGVESEVQEEWLKKMGCHKMQGYLYSRPLPADEFENMLRMSANQIEP